jgi:hypothetical protein
MPNRRMFLTQLATATAVGASGLMTPRAVAADPASAKDTHVGRATEDKPHCVQPDYAAWGRIRENMTEADVLQILGKPLATQDTPEKLPIDDPSIQIDYLYQWTYGHLDFKSPQVFAVDEFYICFSKGRVHSKYDPFGVPLSQNGKPTVPRLIYPKQNASYDHYPRYLDLRWYPSSGQYPMHYIVEHQSGEANYDQAAGRNVIAWPSSSVQTFRTQIPYQLTLHGGSDPGRWRVKAVNALGESDWSEYRKFSFRC